MSPTVEFHFDFGSPNAYFAHMLLPGIEQRTGCVVRYVPVLLGGVFKLTGNQAPMVAFQGIKNKLEYQRLEMQRFIRKSGLTAFRMNPHFPVNTVQIMRAAVAADADGQLRAFADVMFRGMWEQGLKLDEPEVIAKTLAQAGFDGARLLARIQDQDIKQALLVHTEASVSRGNFGSPTFFVGDEMYFGKDRLGDVEAEIVRATSAARG